MGFNLADLNERIAAIDPTRPCIIDGDRRSSYGEVTDRSRRLANALQAAGFGCHTERESLAGHESGQDHLAIYLHTCTEYLEVMLGAMKARVVPFNVNYRYVADELTYVLTDAAPRVLVFHAAFAPIVAAVRSQLTSIELFVQVSDDSGNDLLPGAVEYESLLASAEPAEPPVHRSPDDLYMLYTGGTTGMPKGVLWRQDDVFVAAMGGHPWGQPEPFHTVDEVVAAAASGGARMMTAAPLMHGAAQWLAFTTFTGGNTLVLPGSPAGRFDADAIWATIEREGVLTLQIVGDAFGRPLIESLERCPRDLSGFLVLSNGGAALHPSLKARFLELVPHSMIIDAVGSSETGGQMGNTTTSGGSSGAGFAPVDNTVVVNQDMTRVLTPGDDEIGWLAQRGHVPLGYLGDEAKTAATFPVIDGVRYSVPGDRAAWSTDGTIEFRGRESATINTGGEKVFAEEVEQALLHHHAVTDAMVVGRPSEKWGAEVVAIVALTDGSVPDDELLASAAEHIARYKLPKAIIRRPHLQRSPAGKADYRWARDQAAPGAVI